MYCEICGHINGHDARCPQAPQGKPLLVCTGCGYEFSNGEAYYEIGEEMLCEDCINDCKRIMDVDEYSYDDYLEEEYERRRHDVEY